MSLYGEGEPRSAANLPPSNPITEWGPSLTRQSEAKFADINFIMAKYEQTGVLPPANKALFFADVSKIQDFDGAMAVVHGAEESFMQLPAEVRKEFDNDPSKFISFTNDPENVPKMVEMGLLKGPEDVPAESEIDAAVARVLEKARVMASGEVGEVTETPE